VNEGTPGTAASSSTGVARATADLGPSSGSNVRGTVTFERESGGVHVTADLTGLTPGTHGFHIHEKGDCSAPDGSSAGGHFNPTGMQHGSPDAEPHHMGDLGNIVADSSGAAHYDHVVSFLSLSGANSIVGKAVVVHMNADDLTSQPAGNAGARIACGVIR
jgi:Cu-Zn family superoxide dismutase